MGRERLMLMEGVDIVRVEGKNFKKGGADD